MRLTKRIVLRRRRATAIRAAFDRVSDPYREALALAHRGRSWR